MPDSIETEVLEDAGDVRKASWGPLIADQKGRGWKTPRTPDKTFHVFGVLGGAAVTFQGSNDPRVAGTPGSADWQTLRDAQGEAYTVSDITIAMDVLLPNPLFIRPVVTGGDGTTAINVVIVAAE